MIRIPRLLMSCWLPFLLWVGSSVAEGQPEVVATQATRLEQLVYPITRTDLKLEGSASCSATACHGGPRAGVLVEESPRGAEFPIWLASDPHSQSWRTICSTASVSMLEKLNIMYDGKIKDEAAFDNCLACHNTTRKFSEPRSRQFYAEGIGCAGCHGPSQLWYGDHYRYRYDELASADLGLVPGRNLVARARMCAACHVGDRDRDMNHDIIAAGHPALYYEFATFHNRLPKHWREAELSESADFEAKLWLAGQIAALDASLCLLEARANKSLPFSTWPEFASLECSACHQQLRLETGLNVGTSVAQLSVWNRYGIEQLIRQSGDDSNAQELDETLADLAGYIGQNSFPDPAQARQRATSARYALDAWLTQSPQARLEHFSSQQLRRLVTASETRPETRWESIAQYYLAAVAARMSWSDDALSTTIAEAMRLREALLFKSNTSSLAILDEPSRQVIQVAKRLQVLLSDAQSTEVVPSPR